MNDLMTISAEAQLREAENQIVYFRNRTAALAQHIMDRDAAAALRAAEREQVEADLKAHITALEHELRQARSLPEIIKDAAYAE